MFQRCPLAFECYVVFARDGLETIVIAIQGLIILALLRGDNCMLLAHRP